MAKRRLTKAELVAQNEELAAKLYRMDQELAEARRTIEEQMQISRVNAAAADKFEKQIEEMKQVKQMSDASGLFGYGGTDKEPETEVGYLRRELAYARGQLHQSHLTVKQLCQRINMRAEGEHPSHHGATYKAQLEGSDLDAIHNLNNAVRVLLAEWTNQRDLAAAGIDHNQVAAVTEAFRRP